MNAAIFDIDGTLAKMNGRGPYEWDKVGNDLLVPPVKDLADMMRAGGYKILIFSGRVGNDACRAATLEWLERHGIDHDEFRMRREGDMRNDTLVKEEFYDELKGRYDIIYAVDDRPRVCRLWHKLGLCLLKVGDPDLDF